MTLGRASAVESRMPHERIAAGFGRFCRVAVDRHDPPRSLARLGVQMPLALAGALGEVGLASFIDPVASLRPSLSLHSAAAGMTASGKGGSLRPLSGYDAGLVAVPRCANRYGCHFGGVASTWWEHLRRHRRRRQSASLPSWLVRGRCRLPPCLAGCPGHRTFAMCSPR
jgi:hypothetical protein